MAWRYRTPTKNRQFSRRQHATPVLQRVTVTLLQTVNFYLHRPSSKLRTYLDKFTFNANKAKVLKNTAMYTKPMSNQSHFCLRACLHHVDLSAFSSACCLWERADRCGIRVDQIDSCFVKKTNQFLDTTVVKQLFLAYL